MPGTRTRSKTKTRTKRVYRKSRTSKRTSKRKVSRKNTKKTRIQSSRSISNKRRTSTKDNNIKKMYMLRTLVKDEDEAEFTTDPIFFDSLLEAIKKGFMIELYSDNNYTLEERMKYKELRNIILRYIDLIDEFEKLTEDNAQKFLDKWRSIEFIQNGVLDDVYTIAEITEIAVTKNRPDVLKNLSSYKLKYTNLKKIK